MLIVLSPAKKLDFSSFDSPLTSSEIAFPEASQRLVETLSKFSTAKLETLYSASKNIAELNRQRFQEWEYPFAKDVSQQAIFAFDGDVYAGLEARTLNKTQLNYAQKNLRILSGLYGVLKPSDEILPYRLEMGSKLKVKSANNLYAYWKESVTESLNKDLSKGAKNDWVLDLASKEYSKVIDRKLLSKPLVTPVFKDYKNGNYKIISFFAKKARGLMAQYVIKNKVKNIDQLQKFDLDGYYYVAESSTEQEPVFHRDAN